MALSEAQRQVLAWFGSQPNGVIDITDERIVNRLIERDLVFKFYETDGDVLRPVWSITPAGRAALGAGDE